MKTLAPVHSPPLRVFQPSLQNGHEGMSSAAVFASRVVSRPMSLPVSSEMTLAVKLPIEESIHVSLSLFADALQPLSNSQVQRIKCTACQHNLWRSLKVQSAQRRTTKERIDNSAEGKPSSNMFHHPTNSTIPCLQNAPHLMDSSPMAWHVQLNAFSFNDFRISADPWRFEKWRIMEIC